MRCSGNVLAVSLTCATLVAGCGKEADPKDPVKPKGAIIIKNILPVPIYISSDRDGGNPWPYYNEPRYLTVEDPKRTGEIGPGETAVARCIVYDGDFFPIDTTLHVRDDDGEKGYVSAYSDGTNKGGPVPQIKPDHEELVARLPRCQIDSDG